MVHSLHIDLTDSLSFSLSPPARMQPQSASKQAIHCAVFVPQVFHGSAAAAVSANEMRGLGGPAVQHAYGASPPPQRFYPAPPYVDHSSYSMQQYSSSHHHQLPAWFGQQHQYHTQQQHQQVNILILTNTRILLYFFKLYIRIEFFFITSLKKYNISESCV